MSKPGRFIVVEGLEGAGKSTVVQSMMQYLTQQNIPSISTREPGGTKIGESLRNLIKLGLDGETLVPASELLLMFASRVQLVEHVIKPALAQGIWVISDRFEWSTYAYQGGGRGLDSEFIHNISQATLHDFKPDYTVYLEILPEKGLMRAKSRGEIDIIEQESYQFFSRVAEVYKEKINSTEEVAVIDSSLPLEDMLEQVNKILQSQINLYNNYAQL